MKKIIVLFLFLGLSLISCDAEFLDPTKPTEGDVFSSRSGLIGAANGLQSKWSIGRQSPVYTIITGSGFTTNELRLLNAGNVDEAELLTGGVSVSSKNAVINNLWSQSLVIYAEAQKVLDNIGVISVPVEKASIFKIKDETKKFKDYYCQVLTTKKFPTVLNLGITQNLFLENFDNKLDEPYLKNPFINCVNIIVVDKQKEKRNLQKYSRRLFCNKHIPTDTSMQKLQRVSAGSIPCNHLL